MKTPYKIVKEEIVKNSKFNNSVLPFALPVIAYEKKNAHQ